MIKRILLGLCLISSTLGAKVMDNDTLKQHWNAPKASAEQIVDNLSFEEKVGQILMFDFRYWQENNQPKQAITSPNSNIADIIHRYHLGSVILFRENLIHTAQVIELIQFFQSARSNLPLFISIDQEGGYVTRLQEGTEMPGNMALGATRSAELAKEAGRVHGEELSSLGFNFNFGPVVDINNNQDNPVINVRSYSDNPNLVINLARAYMEGIHQYGIMTSLKHFPGHGNVSSDTHFLLPQINIDRESWRALELKPFEALKNEADAIMTAHVVVPSLDSTTLTATSGQKVGTPATLSKPILTGILRDELKYNGLIITDAMDMGAISNYFPDNWVIKEAILAGNDIILMPLSITSPNDIQKIDSLYVYLAKEAKSDPNLMVRIDESAKRVIQKKLEHRITADSMNPELAFKVVASKVNKAKESFISDRAITMLKNEGQLLPYKLKPENRFIVFSDEGPRNDLIKRILFEVGTETGTQIEVTSQIVKMMKKNLTVNEIRSLLTEQDLVLLVTYNLGHSPRNAQLILDEAQKMGIPTVVISSRNPYDIAYLNNVKQNVAIYGITGFDITNNVRNSLEANIRSGIRTLFELNNVPLNIPTGRLPVAIKDPTGEKTLYPYGFGLSFGKRE